MVRGDSLIGAAKIVRQKQCAVVVGTNVLLLFGTSLGETQRVRSQKRKNTCRLIVMLQKTHSGWYRQRTVMQSEQTYCDDALMIDGKYDVFLVEFFVTLVSSFLKTFQLD
jgi:hypothetical protein